MKELQHSWAFELLRLVLQSLLRWEKLPVRDTTKDKDFDPNYDDQEYFVGYNPTSKLQCQTTKEVTWHFQDEKISYRLPIERMIPLLFVKSWLVSSSYKYKRNVLLSYHKFTVKQL